MYVNDEMFENILSNVISTISAIFVILHYTFYKFLFSYFSDLEDILNLYLVVQQPTKFKVPLHSRSTSKNRMRKLSINFVSSFFNVCFFYLIFPAKWTIQILVELVKLFHIGGPYHIETNPLIWFLYDRDLRHESVKI